MAKQQNGHPNGYTTKGTSQIPMDTLQNGHLDVYQLLRNKIDTPITTQQNGHSNGYATKGTPQ